ncbi:MAG: CPBP family intramembrane metalloprotease, partial [Bacteroidia bacterium]|nr:CPBP family intramembrane metalloprotease [Bacteroidia bacterium]
QPFVAATPSPIGSDTTKSHESISLYRLYTPQLPTDIQAFINKLAFNLHSIFFYLAIPWFYDRYRGWVKLSGFGAKSLRHFDASPYLTMLMIMLPLLVWASFQPAFLHAYPRYLPGSAEACWQVSPWLTVTVYELSYAAQFVALEIFFRGFIVLALARFLGSGAVFPMVAVYAYIHFLKPMPEAIGSVFGGYILGVIAFYSRSVLGGNMHPYWRSLANGGAGVLAVINDP